VQATLGPYATELLSALIKRQQGVWEEIAIRRVQDSELPVGRWGFDGADVRAERRLECAVREFFLELGFKASSSVVDALLDFVHSEYSLPRLKPGSDQIPDVHKQIRDVYEAAEDVLREYKVKARERGNRALADIFGRFLDELIKLECRGLRAHCLDEFHPGDLISRDVYELARYIENYPQPEPATASPEPDATNGGNSDGSTREPAARAEDPVATSLEGNVSNLESKPPASGIARRRGRRPNQERRDAIRNAIKKKGDQWRDHLDQIFKELESQGTSLGDFQGMKIDLGDGESAPVSTWADLDLAVGEQRGQIIDVLRKYV
jgi:hypothetical protein